jgi:hypothetical protein
MQSFFHQNQNKNQNEINHFEGKDDLKNEFGFKGYSGFEKVNKFTTDGNKTNGRFDGSEGTAADRAPIPPSGTSRNPSSIIIIDANNRTPISQSKYIFIAAGLCAVLLVLAFNNNRRY